MRVEKLHTACPLLFANGKGGEGEEKGREKKAGKMKRVNGLKAQHGVMLYLFISCLIRRGKRRRERKKGGKGDEE